MNFHSRFRESRNVLTGFILISTLQILFIWVNLLGIPNEGVFCWFNSSGGITRDVFQIFNVMGCTEIMSKGLELLQVCSCIYMVKCYSILFTKKVVNCWWYSLALFYRVFAFLYVCSGITVEVVFLQRGRTAIVSRKLQLRYIFFTRFFSIFERILYGFLVVSLHFREGLGVNIHAFFNALYPDKKNVWTCYFVVFCLFRVGMEVKK